MEYFINMGFYMNKFKAIALFGLLCSQVGFSSAQFPEFMVKVGRDHIIINEQNLSRVIHERGAYEIYRAIQGVYKNAKAHGNAEEIKMYENIIAGGDKLELPCSFKKEVIKGKLEEYCVDLLKSYMDYDVVPLDREIREKFVEAISEINGLGSLFTEELILEDLERLQMRVLAVRKILPQVLAARPCKINKICKELGELELQITVIGGNLEETLTNYGYLNNDRIYQLVCEYGIALVQVNVCGKLDEVLENGSQQEKQNAKAVMREYFQYQHGIIDEVKAAWKRVNKYHDELLQIYIANDGAPLNPESRRELMKIILNINSVNSSRYPELFIPLDYILQLETRIQNFINLH